MTLSRSASAVPARPRRNQIGALARWRPWVPKTASTTVRRDSNTAFRSACWRRCRASGCRARQTSCSIATHGPSIAKCAQEFAAAGTVGGVRSTLLQVPAHQRLLIPLSYFVPCAPEAYPVVRRISPQAKSRISRPDSAMPNRAPVEVRQAFVVKPLVCPTFHRHPAASWKTRPRPAFRPSQGPPSSRKASRRSRTLKRGMDPRGTVDELAAFGAFVDIGVHPRMGLGGTSRLKCRNLHQGPA